jgi:two-component system NarL family response regulator
MKILLVDDHPIFLEGMKNLLLAGGAHEIETANGGTEALQKAGDFQPDLILMDIMMKPISGLDATRMIKKRFPSMKIVILTASESEEHLFESVKCGACGYLLKNLEGSELFEMLSRFEEGEIPCSPGLAAQLLEEFRKNSDACVPDTAQDSGIERGDVLTKRQEDILRLVASGMKYRDVAEALSITERTVKYSMEQILDRLHMSNRQEAVVYAAQNGIVK